ncbi:unnamed protein product [Cylicostephanus goldi]|uniref:Uncharacterized protein n=1 Tax=Cylicostephanus goldi TaxID=71465 RepID=A0A3P6TMX9_CYLGO|nr:unnamed protein product [Cylicostephanus goldi]
MSIEAEQDDVIEEDEEDSVWSGDDEDDGS